MLSCGSSSLSLIRSHCRHASSAPPSPYASTLCLPRTGFLMRALAAQREPALQRRCTDALYAWQWRHRQDRKVFVLHDGPPYANGKLHMGHVLNKVLKDIVVRRRVLAGDRVHFVPGWDCHGLPIELKALEASSRPLSQMSPLSIRQSAQACAEAAIEGQRTMFRRLGILADWDRPYLTMHPSYEAEQLAVFRDIWSNGFVHRRLKPVFWSPATRTALAEAELIYPDSHCSTAVHMALPICRQSAVSVNNQSPPSDDVLSCAKALSALPSLHALVWTTTPWTLPGNRAVAVGPNMLYTVVTPTAPVASSSIGPLLISADERLLSSVATATGQTFHKSSLSFTGEVLAAALRLLGLAAQNPIVGCASPVITAAFVTAEAGTGLVHAAPGHGVEDFDAVIKAMSSGLYPVLEAPHPSPVVCVADAEGLFNSHAGGGLLGLSVLSDGSKRVIELLQEKGILMSVAPYHHRYPYDWRSRSPVIIRATEQWFIDLSAVKEQALRILHDNQPDTCVKFFPETGRSRLVAMLGSRSEWCISRQRSWGVPIPVFYNTDTGEPLMTAATINHIRAVLEKNGGTVAWWQLSVKDLLPESLHSVSHLYEKGQDTLDVWFDSGVSWSAAFAKEAGVSAPVDMVLEGSDQHRGWFQSSLLSRVASGATTAPFRQLVTHGFVLDANGVKMSKSLGNVIDPEDVINGTMTSRSKTKVSKAGGEGGGVAPAFGADVLRLWVASVDYSRDVTIGPDILQKSADNLRKLRNCSRFMLGNLFDFTPQHRVRYLGLLPVDKWFLHRLHDTTTTISAAYDAHAFHRVYSTLMQFVAGELSSIYFECVKDRLYADPPSGRSRRAAQTVLAHTLGTITRVIAPMLPHLAEDIYEHASFWNGALSPSPVAAPPASVFLTGWVDSAELVLPEWFAPDIAKEWDPVLRLREAVFQLLEKGRSDGYLRSSLDAAVHVAVLGDERDALYVTLAGLATLKLPPSSVGNHLAEVLGTSDAIVGVGTGGVVEAKYRSTSTIVNKEGSSSAVTVAVVKSPMKKCDRCWKRAVPAPPPSAPALCTRCQIVLAALL